MTNSELLEHLSKTEWGYAVPEGAEHLARAMIERGNAALLISALKIAYYSGAKDAHKVNIERLSDGVTGCESRIKLLAQG